tara:strand:- start:5354 stop:5797 length:444 start_codon:yes stop_codon:yes gene_type:complete
MAGKHRPPLTYKKAAKIKTLREQNIPITQIMGEVHCSPTTIYKVMNDPEWQERLKDDKQFVEYRTQIKRTMQAQSLAVSQQALQQMEDKLHLATAPQAAVVFGILRDKERLDAGESTENIAHVHKYDLRKLDRLAENLAKSLMPPKG